MKAEPALPRLHVVTNDEVVRREGFRPLAEEMLEAGGARIALHLRARGASGGVLFDLARRLSQRARASGALLLVNDRVDVALAAGAAGAQVGVRGLAVSDARRLLGGQRVLGASVHDSAEAVAALGGGADFVMAGTLFASASHPGERGSGAEWLRVISAHGGSVIGIGGVTVGRVPEVLEAGAHGVAVIRAVWDAERPCDAAFRLIEALYARD